ncbi:hypothetical protein D3C86_1259120 [compost metagenome]
MQHFHYSGKLYEMAVGAYWFSMQRIMLLLAGLFLSMQVQAQSIIELEREVLHATYTPENLEQRLCEARQLLTMDSLNSTGHFYMKLYFNKHRTDTSFSYIDQLFKQHPHSALPYIIQTKQQYKAESHTTAIQCLYQALDRHPENLTLKLELAKQYYAKFMQPLPFEYEAFQPMEDENTELKPVVMDTMAADSALHYFYQVWRADAPGQYELYFPIRQLERIRNIDPHVAYM